MRLLEMSDLRVVGCPIHFFGRRGGKRRVKGVIQFSPYSDPVDLQFPVSDKILQNIRYPDRNRGNQHNNDYRGRGDDHARQTLTVPRWSVFTQNSVCTSDEDKIPSLSHAQKMDETRKSSCSTVRSIATTLTAVTKMCDIVTERESSCLYEISRLF